MTCDTFMTCIICNVLRCFQCYVCEHTIVKYYMRFCTATSKGVHFHLHFQKRTQQVNYCHLGVHCMHHTKIAMSCHAMQFCYISRDCSLAMIIRFRASIEILDFGDFAIEESSKFCGSSRKYAVRRLRTQKLGFLLRPNHSAH